MMRIRGATTRHARLPLAALSLLAALSAADPAAARRGERYREPADDYTAARRGEREREPVDEYAAAGTRAPGQPLLALVSLQDQRVTIYDADGAILRAPVSSGQTGYETPVGIYAVLQKEAEHYSNRYDDASMPFMQRITWTGVALHAGALPGYPASHGCIRLPYDFAERLFPLTKLGLRVIVSRYDVAPTAVSHALLFKPAPMAGVAGLLTKTVATDAGNSMRLGAAPPADLPPVYTNRAAALQAIVAAKTAEAEEAGRKADAARLVAKQKSGERARAQKALRVADGAMKRAREDVEDADRRLGKATADAEKAQSDKDKTAADGRKQKAQEEKDKAAAKLTETQAKLEAAKAEFQPKIDDYQTAADAAKAAEATRTALLGEARDAQRKLRPVSVFISRATQKLYVRQAFEPVFESPIAIADPDQPIGTHIYTAVDFADGGSAMRWNVVSIGGRRADDFDDGDGRRRGRGARSAEVTPTDAAAANAALDRITIPQDVVERISERMLPGSSLIVSDEPAHKETGKQTDFVVLISGEPQGGIKLRPKPRPDYFDDYYFGNGYYGGYGRRGRGRDGYRGPVFQFW